MPPVPDPVSVEPATTLGPTLSLVWVWVSGVLAQEGQKGGSSTAYRAGPAAWVMRGTRMEPMEAASGSLERQFSYWRGFYRKAALILAVVFTLVHVAALGSYHALFWMGKVEMVPVAEAYTYTTTHKGRTTTHYVIEGKLSPRAGGRIVEDEVDAAAYFQAKAGTMKTVPFMFVPSATWIHSAGARPHLGIVNAILALVAGMACALAFTAIRSAAMPWYEQRRVVEGGQGRLADKAWHRQEPGRPGLFVPRPPKGESTPRNKTQGG